MKKKVKNKINNFILTNNFLRRVRNIFKRFWPIFARFSLALVFLVILLLISFKMFKPSYFDKICKKSSFYFLHYLHLDNREFGEINITGNHRVSKEQIIEVINQSKEVLIKNSDLGYQPLIQNLIDDIKEKLPWIRRLVISRAMPNILNITVEEYNPFAVWQKSDEKFLTDKEGNLIPFEESPEFENMVILSGDGANINARSIFNILVIDPQLSAHVYSATWVGNRRWDIRLDSGLLIKLPENNIHKAWQSLIEIYNKEGSIIGLKMIDLRIVDKIYLEYDNSVVKELEKS